jgi:hypothetical protein
VAGRAVAPLELGEHPIELEQRCRSNSLVGETDGMDAIHVRCFAALAERLAAAVETADEVTAASRVTVARAHLRQASVRHDDG